jgi:hypothetical protein
MHSKYWLRKKAKLLEQEILRKGRWFTFYPRRYKILHNIFGGIVLGFELSLALAR